MKKAHMILYTVSVIGFYISLVMLYVNTASVLGTSLLVMSILTLALGVFFQWRSGRDGSFFCSHAEPVAAVHPAKA